LKRVFERLYGVQHNSDCTCLFICLFRRYLSITANYSEEWEKWWKNPEQVSLNIPSWLRQGDHGGWKSWKSWKISYFLNGARKAGKPVLFSDREARKAGITTFEILENLLRLFLEWFKKDLLFSVK